MRALRTRQTAVIYLLLWATAAALALWLFEDRRAITTIALVAAVPGAYLAWVGFARSEAAADRDTKVRTLAAAVGADEARQRAQMIGPGAHRIDLAFTYRPEPFNGVTGAAPQGRLTDVVAYYRRLRPARLVISGEPGAGKTLLALDLLLGLLTHPDRQDADPVPVRFSLASWDTTRPLPEWLAEQVHDQFSDCGISLADAKQLVEEHRVLPVLDGLDEMDTVTTPAARRRATRALQQLNAYQGPTGSAPVIITCRTTQYTELAAVDMRMREAVRIEIDPVTPDQASAYLTGRSTSPTRWSSVLNALTNAPGDTLAEALGTPWRLNLAATVYEERDQDFTYLRDPDQLLILASPDEVREHLLAHYVSAATRQHPTRPLRYRPDQAHRWLAALAAHLATPPASAGVGTDLVLHELWPMAGPRRVRVFDTLLALLLAVGVLSFASWISAHDPHRVLTTSSLDLLLGTALLGLAVVAQASRGGVPEPKRVRLQRLRRAAANLSKPWLAGALVGTSTAWFFAIFLYGFTKELAIALVGTTTALFMFMFGLVLAETVISDSGPTDPRSPVRQDFTFGVTCGIVAGLMVGLGAGLVSVLVMGLGEAVSGLVKGALYGFLFGLMVGLYLVAGAGRRYLVFLCCARGRLPWRLGSFLHWAYGAGLIRISGVAYQFRHRELQDWLTAHTLP